MPPEKLYTSEEARKSPAVDTADAGGPHRRRAHSGMEPMAKSEEISASLSLVLAEQYAATSQAAVLDSAAASSGAPAIQIPAPSGQRLVGIDDICPGRVKVSARTWKRYCDTGVAPPGVKIAGRRLWDLHVVDRWISTGCKPVARRHTGRA